MITETTDISKRYENTLVAISFFTWGTVFLERMSQLYLAPYIAPEFHLTHEQVGMLGSVLAITWAVSTLLFGALAAEELHKLRASSARPIHCARCHVCDKVFMT